MKTYVALLLILATVLIVLPALALAQDTTQPPAPSSGALPDGPRRGGEDRPRPAFGKISALDKNSIEITAQDGSKLTFKLTASTEFRKEREAAKFSDFKVGDNVIVRTTDGQLTSGSTAAMVAAIPAGFMKRVGLGGAGPGGPGAMMMQGTLGKDYVVGEVKSIDAPKITVQRTDNVSQTLELNEETSLRRGRDGITMADIAVGDHIFANGSVTNNVFVPKSVRVIPAEQWNRMQQGGGPVGQRAPGGETAPAAAPGGQGTPPAPPPQTSEQLN
ncbi:MAG TPA: DUF5666 domain-containing protein [Dongiaceae bacterium]|nr:DUF5666 domain-containing protein [Dongiaceae bacterium]